MQGLEIELQSQLSMVRQKKPSCSHSHWSFLIWAKSPDRCLVGGNGETDSNRGWKSRGEGKRGRLCWKNEGRERKISMMGAVEKGGKGSCRRKHFTDICSNSERHKRAWRKLKECWTDRPKSWTHMDYLNPAAVNHLTLPARTACCLCLGEVQQLNDKCFQNLTLMPQLIISW